MIVAVTPALRTVAEQLRERGYNVVTYGKYNHPIDALIYTGENLLSANIIASAAPGWHGVLMINAENKTISQIDYMLKNRVFSPLF
ncbi:MAG: YkuS family protein [Firmicutes bacterium]|nr:YkuS family protein [Bacillota bacterium]